MAICLLIFLLLPQTARAGPRLTVSPDPSSDWIFQGDTARFIIRGGNPNTTYVVLLTYDVQGLVHKDVWQSDLRLARNGSGELLIAFAGAPGPTGYGAGVASPGKHWITVANASNVEHDYASVSFIVWPNPAYAEQLRAANVATSQALWERAKSDLIGFMVAFVAIVIILEIRRWWNYTQRRTLLEVLRGWGDRIGGLSDAVTTTETRAAKRNPELAASVECVYAFHKAQNLDLTETRLREKLGLIIEAKRNWIARAEQAARIVEEKRPGDRRVRPVHRLKYPGGPPEYTPVAWDGRIALISTELAVESGRRGKEAKDAN